MSAVIFDIPQLFLPHRPNREKLAHRIRAPLHFEFFDHRSQVSPQIQSNCEGGLLSVGYRTLSVDYFSPISRLYCWITSLKRSRFHTSQRYFLVLRVVNEPQWMRTVNGDRFAITPSMRRPVDVKAHFRFLPSMSLFPFSQAASVAILPSALFCERYSLGARWVFSFQ